MTDLLPQTVEVHHADFMRLVAIEAAAREYRKLSGRDEPADGWMRRLIEARKELFALLDSPPVQ